MKKSSLPPVLSLVLVPVVAVVLALAAWFAGPRLGLSTVTARWTAGAILLAAVLALVAWAVVRAVRAPRAGRTPGFARAASSGPVGSSSVGERLDRTIQWLKSSKLAETGRDPVYQLPWYLLLGAAGSGKSTLVVQSGFSFSYTEPKKPLGRPTVTPTEGCDLWVANEAVFIDPSGTFFSSDAAKGTWHATLDQIKQRRKARPVDGIVLVVDSGALLALGHDELRLEAERSRSFLDMTSKAFGMVLPVYLVFSKADEIDGFKEFFRGLAGGGSAPLGATFRQEQFQNPHPEEEFRAAFDEIHQSLLARRSAALAGSEGVVQERAFAFPAQLPLIRNQLSEFIEVLFQADQFREQPLFRGFYLTSALQTGETRSPVADLLSAKAGLPPVAATPAQETKGYFINPLFTRVVISDRGLAGLSQSVRRWRLRWRMAALALAGIVLPIVLLASSFGAYEDSRALFTSAAAVERLAATDGKTTETLAALAALQRRLESFECLGQTDRCQVRGRRFYWGLYPGEAALDQARTAYLDKLRQLFLDPLVGADTRLGQKYNGLRIQLDLIAAAAAPAAAKTSAADFDPGKTYSLLKTFLMLSSESRADPAFLESQMRDYWVQGVQDRDKPVALSLLRYYLHQLGDHHNPAYRLARTRADDETVDRARKLLLVVEPDRYYYGILQADGQRKVDSITLGGILGGQASTVLDAAKTVEGTYTKAGWESFAKDEIAAMTKDYDQQRSWVLGIPAGSPGEAKIDQQLRTLYFNDYQQRWWDFLKSIEVRRVGSFQEAADKISQLTDPKGSPLALLMKAVSLNTFDDLDRVKPGDSQAAQAALDGAGGMRFAVAQSFQGIHSLVARKENQESPLDQYLKTLSRLQVVVRTFLDANQPAGQIPEIGREGDNVLQTANALLANLDANTRTVLEPMLKLPVQQVLAIVNRSTPVGTVKDERQRGLTVGGSVKDKGKGMSGATVVLLEAYSDSKFQADKEVARAQAQNGEFQFPNLVNPGPFKICVTKKGETNYYCGDVRLDKSSSGKAYELKRPRSLGIFGGGKLDLTVRIR